MTRYGLNIGFNLNNKALFNYFPYPWTVSTIHVVVGALYCGIAYLLGAKKASYERVSPAYRASNQHERCLALTLLLKTPIYGVPAAPQQPITKEEFKLIFPPAFMHAAGHVAANLSFAAVAISLTHTVKTLEPVFNVIMSYIFMGTVTPFPVLLTLLPIMVSGRGIDGAHRGTRDKAAALLKPPHPLPPLPQLHRPVCLTPRLLT